MCTSVDPSRFLLLNIDSGDEWRRPRNTLESSPSPDPRHVAFAFAFRSNTSYFYVREVLVVMGPDDTDARLRSLLSLTVMENRLTIHFALMDLRRCRAFGKMLHENGPGNRASKDPVPITQVIDDALSRPTHGRMARLDGFCLGHAEEPHAHDEQGDCWDDGLSESHDYSLHLYGGVGSAIISSASIPFSPRYSPAKDKPAKARTSRVNLAHNSMHTRTCSLQIQQPFSDTLAREPSFVSLLKYTSLRGFHALLDSSLT